MELFKGNKAKTVNLLFQSLLVTYLILLLTEQIWQKSVSLYMNLNYLLIIVIVAGILDVFSEHEEQKDEKAKKRDYIFMAILGILGFIILKFKTADLGWLSWVISAVAGVLIVLLSMLILGNDEEISYEKEKISKIKWKTIVPLILVALVLISAGLGLFTSLGYLESFRIVFGSVYVLFLPGFIISFIFFPKTKEYGSEQEKGAIDWIERVALSFALSIAVVPLLIFYLNLIGIKINLLNSFFTILGIIITASAVLLIKKERIKNKVI